MRTKVFYDLPNSACYGCQACAQICPVAAISMESNKEGFLYPQIDTDKCIECNLCQKSCPTQTDVVTPLFHETPTTVDAAWEKEKGVRLQSTSGGVFYALGKNWIDSGGIVYGAILSKDLKVVHSRASTIEELQCQRKSKYVQSDLTGILTEIKKELINGKRVLFSGTPCQVAGLRSFLKKDYPNLLTVDVVCHGVPSPQIFADHLKYVNKIQKDTLVDYQFRGKEKSGWRAYIKYIFKDKTVNNLLGKDFYSFSFYHSYFNRLSCFNCNFSQSKRVGDITLSDFWNAEKECKPLRIQRKNGFNMVMCNTLKGEEIYTKIKDQLDFLTLPSEVAINGDVRLRNTEPEPDMRTIIFNDYSSNGYEYVVKKYGPRNKGTRNIPNWIKNLVCEIRARL